MKKMKKNEKNILIGSLSVLGLGAVVGTSIAITNEMKLKTDDSLSNQEQSNNVFSGTTLTNEDVKKIGWDRKTTISLSDWEKQAPNVTGLGNSDSQSAPFYANNRLESIEIPAKVTNINNSAFYSTPSLTRITFESNSQLANIGSSAFNNSAIKEIVLPESVTSIGSDAFKNTNNLSPDKITLPESIKGSSSGPLYGFSEDQWEAASPSLRQWTQTVLTPQAVNQIGWNRKENITLNDWKAQAPNVTNIGLPSQTSNNGAPFRENKILKTIEIPAKITAINHSAFESATNLAGLVFEDNSQLREIGWFAFQNTKLTEFRIPDRVTTLRDTIFGSQTPITRLFVNDQLNIVQTPFHAMSNLTSVSMPKKYSGNTAPGPEYWGFTRQQWNSIVTFRPDVFRGDILTKQDVRNLGWDRQARITRQDWADFAPNVTQLSSPNVSSGSGANSAFSGVTSLQHIELPDKIRKINYATFFQARNLRTVDLTPNSQLDTIRGYSFRQSGVSSIYIPRNVTSIGEHAFEESRSLERVTFHPESKLTNISRAAFNLTQVRIMDIPDSIDTIATAFEQVNSNAGLISMPLRMKRNSTTGLYGFNNQQWNLITFRPEIFLGEILTKAIAVQIGWDKKTRITLQDWQRWAPNVKQLGDPNVNSGSGSASPFQGNTNLRSIEIPDRITSINFGAFADATSLNSVQFYPTSGLTRIRGYAFKNTRLTGMVIPANVTEIGEFAFLLTANLSSVTFAGNSKVTSIGVGAFKQSGLRNINIPNSVTSIGIDAFQDTRNTLFGRNVSMSRDLQRGSNTPLYGFTQTQWSNISWRKAPFRGTTLTKQDVINLGWDKVTTITLDDWKTWAPNVTDLGNPSITSGVGRDAPFSFNSTLQSIVIPAKVRRLNYSAFHQTPALRTVNFEANSQLNTIAGYVFRISGITNISIPNSVTTIGEAAFKETDINNITLPNSLTSLGNEVFSEARRLTSINIPAGVKALGRQSFKDTSALTTITFSANSKLTTIGVEAFWRSGITKIVVPKSVTSLQNFAFIQTRNLTSLTFEAGSRLTTIGERAFQETRSTEIDIPDSVTSMHANALGSSGFTHRYSISSTLRNGSLVPIYGLNQSQWNSVIWKVKPFTGTVLKKVDVVNLNWWGKTQITLQDWNSAASVTHIGVDASSGNINESPFAGNTTLTSVVLPSRVTHIGYNAFSGTTALRAVTFQDGSKLTNIGTQAFDRSTITSIDIPDSVTTIANNAFTSTQQLMGAQISMSSKLRKGSLTGRYGFTDTQWEAINWRIAKFEGTVLQKVDVIDLNWHKKTSITLNDWTTWAPNVTKISQQATSGPGGRAAFAGNNILQSIQIPAKITEINYASFYQTTSLRTLTFAPNSKLTTFGVGSFEFSTINAITIPASVVSIQERAFNQARSLATVTFEEGSSLNNIDQQAFYEVRSLKEITLPNKLKVIGRYAFWNAKALTKVYVPNSVTSIGELAFNGADALRGQNVSILITLRTGDSTNYGFTQGQWNTIDWRVIPFDGTILTKQAVNNLGWHIKDTITLQDWETSAPKVTAISESATMGQSPTAAFIDNTRLQSITIPSRVTRINFGSFRGTTALQTVAFERNSALSIIEAAAFRLSSLNSIEIPASVTSIGNAAFQSSTSFRSINFAQNSSLTSIGDEVFDGTPLSTINVPSSVTSIGANAFRGTGSLQGQNVSMDISLKQNSTDPLYGFTSQQWNTIAWRGTVTLRDTVNASFLIEFTNNHNIVTLPPLNPKASSGMSAAAKDAGLSLQFAIGPSASSLIIDWGSANEVKTAITTYTANKSILRSEMNIYARMYLPRGTGENNNMIGNVTYNWTKTSIQVYESNAGIAPNLFVAPGTTSPILSNMFIRAFGKIDNNWASSLSAGGNKASAVKVTSTDGSFNISTYTAMGVDLEISVDNGTTWKRITILGQDTIDASAHNKVQFRLNVSDPKFYQIDGSTVVPNTTPAGIRTQVVEKEVIAKKELSGILASNLITDKLAVSGSTHNITINENPDLYTATGMGLEAAKAIFEIKYTYDGTTYFNAAAFKTRLSTLRANELNRLVLTDFKVRYEFTSEGLEKYYSTQVANDPEAAANTTQTLVTTNVKKTIDLTSQIEDIKKIRISGSTESFTWTGNEFLNSLSSLVQVQYGSYVRSDAGTVSYQWSNTMPTSLYTNTIPEGNTNFPLAIRFMPREGVTNEEIGSIDRSGNFAAADTERGYQVDASTLVSVINVDTTNLAKNLIFTGFANNLNNGATDTTIETNALNLVDEVFRNQVKLEYQLSTLVSDTWLSLNQLRQYLTQYINDNSNETSGILIFNNGTIPGVTIKARFVAKDPDKYMVVSQPTSDVMLDTSQIKTSVDLRGYINILKTQKVIPSGTSAGALGTLTLPAMPSGSLPFSGKTYQQIAAILSDAIDIEFKAPGFHEGAWVPLERITAVNVNNELYIRFVVKTGATSNIELSLVNANDWQSHQNTGFKLSLSLPLEIQVDSADLVRWITLTGNTKELGVNDDEVYKQLNTNELYVDKVQILYTIGTSPMHLDPSNPEKTEFTKNELVALLKQNTIDITIAQKQITAKYALAGGISADDYIIKDSKTVNLSVANVLLYINRANYYELADKLTVSGTSSAINWGPELDNLIRVLSPGLILQFSTDNTAVLDDPANSEKWKLEPPTTIDPTTKFLVVRMVVANGYVFEENPKLFNVDTSNVLLVITLQSNWLEQISLTGNTKDIVINLDTFNGTLNTAGIPGKEFLVVEYNFGAPAPANLGISPDREWFTGEELTTIFASLQGAKNEKELILFRNSIRARYSLNDQGYETYRMNIDGQFINGKFPEQQALWKNLVTESINASFEGYINLNKFNAFTADSFQIFGSDKKPQLRTLGKVAEMFEFYKNQTTAPFDVYYSNSQSDFSNQAFKLFDQNGFIDRFNDAFTINLDTAGNPLPIYFKIVARTGYKIYENNTELANGKVITITNFDIQPQITNPLKQAPEIRFKSSTNQLYFQGEGSLSVYVAGTNTLVDQKFLNAEHPDVVPHVLELEYHVSETTYTPEELAAVAADKTQWSDQVPTNLKVGQYVMARVALNNPKFTLLGGDTMTPQIRVHGLKVRTELLQISQDLTLTNSDIYGYAPLDGQTKIETASLVADASGNYLGADLQMSVNTEFYRDVAGKIILDANNIPIVKRDSTGATQEGFYLDAFGKPINDSSGQPIPIWTIRKGDSVIPAPPLNTGSFRSPQKMIDWSVPGSFTQFDDGSLDWRLFEGQVVRFSFIPRVGQGTTENPDFVFDTPAARLDQPEITLSTIKYIIPTKGINYSFDQDQLKDITYAPDDNQDQAYTGASHISSPLKIVRILPDFREEILTGKDIETQVNTDFDNRVQIKMQLTKQNGTSQTAFGSNVEQFTGLQNGDVISITFESKDPNYALPRPIPPLTIVVKGLFVKPLDVNLFKFLRPDFTGSLNGSGAFSIKVTNPNNPTETNETILGIDQWYEYQVWNPDKSLKTAWTRDETRINNLVNGDKVEWKLVNKDGVFIDDYYNTLLAQDSTPENIQFRVVNVEDKIEQTVQAGIGSSSKLNPDLSDGTPNYPENSGWLVSGLKIEITLDSIQQEKFEQALAQFQPTFSGVDKFGQMSSNISNDSSISKDVVIVWYTSSSDGMPRRITDFKEAGLSNGDKVWATIAPSQEAIENNLIIDESISQMSSKVFIVEGLTTIVNSTTQTLMVSLITASSVILVGMISSVIFIKKRGKLNGNKKF